MAVQMEWMLARVIVVENDFDYVSPLENIGVCVIAINCWIAG